MLKARANTEQNCFALLKTLTSLFVSALLSGGKVVACDGIEPPTRGFSILCSTD